MTTSYLFRRTGFIISVSLLLPFYLVIVLFTDYSLTGFLTDIIFFFLLSSCISLLIVSKTTKARWRFVILRASIIVGCLMAFNWAVLNLINPFITDLFKLRSFYFQKVNGRMFHAYFKPVGSYSVGEGNKLYKR